MHLDRISIQTPSRLRILEQQNQNSSKSGRMLEVPLPEPNRRRSIARTVYWNPVRYCSTCPMPKWTSENSTMQQYSCTRQITRRILQVRSIINLYRYRASESPCTEFLTAEKNPCRVLIEPALKKFRAAPGQRQSRSRSRREIHRRENAIRIYNGR